jgi:two-component system, chemotaxis family, protein-glutamate methylesterase/glutaminase
MPDPIKVLIVEDSPTVSRILKNIIEADAQLSVVGVATDGAEAIRMTARLRPNILTMDVNMPRMSGIEATEYIMAHYPTPILVLTAISKHDVDISFDMLSAGALEIIQKPAAEDWKSQQNHICERIKLLSRIKVITHVRAKNRALPDIVKPPEKPEKADKNAAMQATAPDAKKTTPLDPSKIIKPPVGVLPSASVIRSSTEKISQPLPPAPAPPKELLLRKFEAVGIAASTGGPPALAKLLREFPANMSVPVFVVQHIPAGFSQGLAEWLDTEVPLKVRLATEGERPVPGYVYLPADDRHMTFYPDGRVRLDDSPSRYGLRPSADITFEGMSKTWGKAALGVILTGMGRDGSVGLQKLQVAGGYTIAQDEATSVIFGMPKAAIELGVINKVLPLGHIAPFIKQIIKL